MIKICYNFRTGTSDFKSIENTKLYSPGSSIKYGVYNYTITFSYRAKKVKLF